MPGLPFADDECDSVVVGLAPERLNYDSLNKAFRIRKRSLAQLTDLCFLTWKVEVAREPLTASSPRPPRDAPRTLLATVRYTHAFAPMGND